MMTAGIPDLYARHPRWKLRLWIEVKTPRGRVRPAQAAWIEAERAAGGHAIVARSVSDVLDALREAGAPIDLGRSANHPANQTGGGNENGAGAGAVSRSVATAEAEGLEPPRACARRISSAAGPPRPL